MTARAWQTSTALRRNAFLASDELLLIADQGSPQDNAAHAAAIEQLLREKREVESHSAQPPQAP